MRKLLFLILIGLLFACSDEESNKIKDTTEYRKISSQFVSRLGSVLMKEMQTGGPMRAVAVCADTAQNLTNSIGKEFGVEISRVSLKSRNPLNTPDENESAVLKQFDKFKLSGELTDTTEFAQMISRDGVNFIHYMKPITTQPICLTCHGSEKEVSPEVENLIKSKYPEDKARGYKTGDVRGAISIYKQI